jgi:hypothetical protein
VGRLTIISGLRVSDRCVSVSVGVSLSTAFISHQPAPLPRSPLHLLNQHWSCMDESMQLRSPTPRPHMATCTLKDAELYKYKQVGTVLRGDGRVDPLGLLCQLLRRRRGLFSGGQSTGQMDAGLRTRSGILAPRRDRAEG